MTSSEVDRRVALAAKVSHDLAINRRKLPVVLGDGSRPIVVALDEDLLSNVALRVQQSGGSANLFVELPHDDVVLFAVASSEGGSRRAELFSDKPMHGDVTIGMLATYASTAPEGVQVIVKIPKLDADVQYVERRELVDI